MMMFGGLLLRLGCGRCAVIALVPSVVGLVAAFVAYVTAGCLFVWLLAAVARYRAAQLAAAKAEEHHRFG